MKNTIIYDHPLNEVIRVCLRLEQLFQQVDHQLNDTSIFGTRSVIILIISILQLLDRPDLKAKLAKELSTLHENLQRYGHLPHVDGEKLSQFSVQLDELSRSLIDSSGKIGQRLRDMELLNNLRLHLANPGGGCSFEMPLYHYWLQQPAPVRNAIMTEWLTDFTQIRSAVGLVLELVRNNAKIEEKSATHGFYQELLDPQSNLRMIRIGIERDVETYPEVSIGRHFFSVRFYSPDILKRPVQFTKNLTFWVAYCNS
jgi:cell division protein ZapD